MCRRRRSEPPRRRGRGRRGPRCSAVRSSSTGRSSPGIREAAASATRPRTCAWSPSSRTGVRHLRRIRSLGHRAADLHWHEPALRGHRTAHRAVPPRLRRRPLRQAPRRRAVGAAPGRGSVRERGRPHRADRAGRRGDSPGDAPRLTSAGPSRRLVTTVLARGGRERTGARLRTSAHEALRRLRRRRRDRLRPSHAGRDVRLPRAERRGQELDDADDRRRSRPPSGGTLRVLGLDPARTVPRSGSGSESSRRRTTSTSSSPSSENLMIYGRYFGLPRDEIRRRIDELLEFVQLADRRETPVDSLSGGMKRRLTIARALVNDPRPHAPRRADDRSRPAGPPRRSGTGSTA